ncbi:probable tyrosyl-DNA phosphodiesterase isoform X2 [Aethina tumida]|uniref:probable tyrosyl-DNA phosphodiesterase isoform X2 n=1 Tax=Aethina tumida TaxID=116153 RepID=UPI002148E084|nr:probable tyrosyl-DNA phosphodiesterase isoform X2 [Aethina tumida]
MASSLQNIERIKQKTDFLTLSSIKILDSDRNFMKYTMLEKLVRTAPYNLFFTTISKSPETSKQNNSATFTDILCPSLGKLEESLQINFMLDINWLLEQYKVRGLSKQPLTIIYGYDCFEDMQPHMDKYCPNVTYKFVELKFGCHHSKVGIYVYSDKSIRVVVSTANLYYEDWNHYNQSFWMSPKCPQLPEDTPDTSGESPTGFKMSLINYLKDCKFDILNKWIKYVKRTDFSAVKVFLVTSLPGKHYPTSDTGCHLHRVGDLLSRHCVLPTKTGADDEGPLDSWSVVAQASALGCMGESPAKWLHGQILRCLASHSESPSSNSPNVNLFIIFPTINNVMKGYYGSRSGGCLPYSKAIHREQWWLQDYIQWKADKLTRTRAMPHSKGYTRISPCLGKLAYFLLTSANLSKSAWGGPVQKDNGTHVNSYEVGVLFLPKFFGEEYFEIDDTMQRKSQNIFPLMYDLPLVAYDSCDYPYCN